MMDADTPGREVSPQPWDFPARAERCPQKVNRAPARISAAERLPGSGRIPCGRRSALVMALLLVVAAAGLSGCNRPRVQAGSAELPTATAVSVPATLATATPAVTTEEPHAGEPPASAPVTEAGRTMQNYLTSLTDNGQFMGSVLVAQDSTLILADGFGFADIEAQHLAAPETCYRIGSITKQFTAAAVLHLQDQGRLTVDAPVSAYLPDYPNADRITVHHLLTHTSGIPDYERLPVYMETLDQPATTAELVARFADLPLQFSPGRRFAYSSSNYMVLTRIIEEVSGKSYGEFLQDEFFRPLYMTQTGPDDGDFTAADRARGYIPARGQLGPARGIDMSIPSGAGALVTNVFDLYGWIQALQQGLVLEAPAVEQLFTPYVAMESSPRTSGAQYGYGWVIDESLGRTRYWHPGHIFGYAALVATYPEDNATVIVLSNIEGADVQRIEAELARILFEVRE